jgi:peptidyl-tRNA hydrolase, PTH2 family
MVKVVGSKPASRSHAVLAQLVEALPSEGRGSRFESAVRHVDEVAEQRPTKQVIVIRRDLRMRRGKEIAQGAHASTAWLAERVLQAMTPVGSVDHVELSEAERAWLTSSFRKVTVKVGSEAELLAVYEKALEAGLVAHLITDRGLTEFGGVPTRTCLGIGPDYDDLIDPVTGDLELY